MWEFIIAKILRISSVTEYERALLVGEYLSFSKNNGIDPRLLKRGFTDQQLAEMRKAMGSRSIIGLNIRFENDIKSYKHPNSGFIYTIFQAWDKHNALPFSGGYSEQPNKVIEYFSIMDELKFEAEQKAHAEAIRESKQNRNKK